jgi:hypothetical protein
MHQFNRGESLLDESTSRRLSFIRYLYTQAVEQADEPEPFCAASVLSFHDAIEMFLGLACEHKNVSVPVNTYFMQYWERLDPVLQPDGLSQKRSMTRLDKARGNLKHQGIRPSKEDVDSHHAAARLFFEENTPTVFAVELHRVSLVSFVRPIHARQDMEEAVSLKEQGDVEGSLIKIAIAFDKVIDVHRQGARLFFAERWPPFLHDRARPSRFRPGLPGKIKDTDINEVLGELVSQTDFLGKTVFEMAEAFNISVLGLDYRRYTKFQHLVPWAQKMADGSYSVSAKPEPFQPHVTEADWRFCRDFVIDASIRTQRV